SQMQLANKTGISQSAIAKWELGKTEPTATAIITLAKFFNESSDYLLGLED
ncbi:MAG: helix-turn-helix transcriptional regulator, partial [Clostridia bacterium]|nr:helix-turn-helix transcriptional regulator [Clostridia bacterium]MBO5927161.1 helix-turn-helix transcriptional regulator [Clostridia bacterium]